MVTTRSISKSSSLSGSGGCGVAILVVFGLLFGAAGLGVLGFTTIRPLYLLLRAQSWQPAQCEILFSQVESSRKGDTSRINMQYRYTWNDRPYTGHRYDFEVGSDNIGNAAKDAVVAAHRPGQSVACFVNAADPTESVITREFHWKYLMGAAFGLPFALVPMLLVSLVIYGRRRNRTYQARQMGTTGVPVAASFTASSPSSLSPGMPSASTTTFGSSVGSGPVVLKPETSRVARLAGMIFICLFW